MQPPHTAYDELPYDSLPIAGTSPRRLALCSFLHAGPRPPLSGFRALEIGCNNGQNLLPMAFYHPNSSFVGVDNAESALTAGRKNANVLGLENLRLEWMDLTAPSELVGTFHYVLIHGVFSWVDANVRRRILEICRAHLAPDGVVYLSHNVDAGWRIRGLVRDVVMDGVADLSSAAARNQRAREVAAELCDIVDESELPYHVMLAGELRRVVNSTESYLAHETLSPENVAFRHEEIVAMLARHGFSYLADALYDRPEGRRPEALAAALGRLGAGGTALEQLADVLGYRRFRSSVFCREDARPSDPEAGVMAALGDMFVASTSGEPAEDEPPVDAGFTLPADEQLAAALLLLATEWPGGMRVSDLIARSSRLIDSAPMADVEIHRRLREMHIRGRVALSLIAPPRRALGEDGVPHRLARFQAAKGHDMTTASHEAIGLEGIEREIVCLLGDGSGADAVVEELMRRVDAGELVIETEADERESALRTGVRECLDTLGRWGLLEQQAPQ